MIGSFVRSNDIVSGLVFPGDIDILVIPYEGDELVLSQTLTIEIKVIRASFTRQGKSPNEFGFSQAQALLANGFPYVAVGHLIVADRSPMDAWREVAMASVLDNEGRCGPFKTIQADMLPWDLLCRSDGRLIRNCPDPTIGHFAAYPAGAETWMPRGKPAVLNVHASREVMDGVYAYYQNHYRNFLWTRRMPPSAPCPDIEGNSPEFLDKMLDKMRHDFS